MSGETIVLPTEAGSEQSKRLDAGLKASWVYASVLPGELELCSVRRDGFQVHPRVVHANGLLRGAIGENRAVVDQQGTIAMLADVAHVVRDQQDRLARLAEVTDALKALLLKA